MLKRSPPPKVTIGIPTFNRSMLLSQAIDSALYQTYQNIEVVVSDNGPTDNTKEILSGYFDDRLTILKQPKNLGMVGNWNCCLANASGEFFLLLSDDDVLEENTIEKLMLGFEHEAISLSYGPVSYMDKDGKLIQGPQLYAPQIESGIEFISNVLQEKRTAYPSTTLYRTVEAKKVGGYPDIGTTTDFGLHVMLAMKDLVYYYPFPVGRYRIHNESESFSESAMLSQLNLINWFNNTNWLPKQQSRQLQEYSTNMVYRLGRYHALRGNDKASIIALSVLLKIHPSVKWKLMFFLFSLTPVRWLAKIRQRLLQRHT